VTAAPCLASFNTRRIEAWTSIIVVGHETILTIPFALVTGICGHKVAGLSDWRRVRVMSTLSIGWLDGKASVWSGLLFFDGFASAHLLCNVACWYVLGKGVIRNKTLPCD